MSKRNISAQDKINAVKKILERSDKPTNTCK